MRKQAGCPIPFNSTLLKAIYPGSLFKVNFSPGASRLYVLLVISSNLLHTYQYLSAIYDYLDTKYDLLYLNNDFLYMKYDILYTN